MLEILRRSYNLTQSEVADALGISRFQVLRIEQGRAPLHDRYLFNAARHNEQWARDIGIALAEDLAARVRAEADMAGLAPNLLEVI